MEANFFLKKNLDSNFEEILDERTGKMPSMIVRKNNSSFLTGPDSLVDICQNHQTLIDEYTDDDDPGFDLYEVAEREFPKISKQLAEKYGFPARAVLPDTAKGKLKIKMLLILNKLISLGQKDSAQDSKKQ